MENTIILPCSCTSNTAGNPNAAAFQDSKYGKGMRVHNKLGSSKSKDTSAKARCSICSTERTV